MYKNSIKNNLLKNRYDSALKKLKQIDNKELLEPFFRLIENLDLLKEDCYDFVINQALKITDPNILEVFINIATDENLLKENKYYYELIISEAIKINDLKSLELFYYIVTSPDFRNKDNIFIIKCINKMNYPKLLKQFCDLIINLASLSPIYFKKYFNYVLSKSLRIENENIFPLYTSIATNSSLLNSNYYEYTINKILEVKSDLLLGQIYYLVTNQVLLESKYYNLIIEKALEINDPDYLSSFVIKVLDEIDNFNKNDLENIRSIIDLKSFEKQNIFIM